jgi:branched-chain amino acid transport system ATP-binding protein
MSGPALKIDGLVKQFGGLCAVDNVTFDIYENSITALIGPNGAGKTTVFNLITNIYKPSRGKVSLFGQSILNMRANQIAALGLIRTFQTARVFPGMTVVENVLSGAYLHIQAGPVRQMLWLASARREERALVRRADELLELFNLSTFRDESATDLPMGAQKILEVIRALMAKPRLLLLDEPAAGLNDSETAELSQMIDAVRHTGVGVLVVEHNMSLVMGIADKVLVLDAGRLVAQGSPEEIQRNPQVIEAYVGQDFDRELRA